MSLIKKDKSIFELFKRKENKVNKDNSSSLNNLNKPNYVLGWVIYLGMVTLTLVFMNYQLRTFNWLPYFNVILISISITIGWFIMWTRNNQENRDDEDDDEWEDDEDDEDDEDEDEGDL
jgi:hypothetical protein